MRQISVDVEDYRSLVIRDKLGMEGEVSSTVDAEMKRLLDLLDELQVKATCFVVGKLARERPHVVREIAGRGHEVASHGYEHLRMEKLPPAEFTKDLRASIRVLEDITGDTVEGFRAPAFSLSSRERWAFEIMAEEGIRFDSSVRLVWPWGRRAGQATIDAARLCGIQEYPGIAIGYGRFRFPLAGGGGLRMIPEFITRWGVRHVRRAGFSVPTYIHPYDLTLGKYEDEWPTSSWSRAIRLKGFDWIQRRGRSNVADRLRNAATWQSEEFCLRQNPPTRSIA